MLSVTLCNICLATASAPITITINGQVLPTDLPPIVKDGRTLVPLRVIFEALGAQVSWDGSSGRIAGTKANLTIVLNVGNKSASINGNAILLDITPQIINGRTMVPTRFVAESLGAKVEWNAASRTVSIISDVNRSIRASINFNRIPLPIREIVALVQPATVLVQTSRASGSGFFVTTDGVVLTNAHVVSGSQWIKIKDNNGQTYTANIIVIDNAKDLALIKVSAKEHFPIIEYMSFINNVSVGEEVVAFGNPLGLEKTVTRGIVSAKREQALQQSWTGNTNIIQHDATIGPGSSGGALVNLYGELIGINTSGYLTRDFSFAVSVDHYYWLSKSSSAYSLKEDWDCYFTESFEWHEVYLDITSKTTNAKNLGETYVLFSQALYRLENLRQVVNSYYPQFHEIKELKSLYLEVLGAKASIFRYIIDISQNPYLYSESQFNYLYNAWNQAYNAYYAKYRVLFEQFR